MDLQPRIYQQLIESHLSQHRQIAIISGPRQVGKTTLCREEESVYFNWDNLDHRALILQGPGVIAELSGLNQPRGTKPTIVFDELHKFPRWKQFLKGFFDTYESDCRILVTGSAKLDFFRRGGDSLMGRYLPYRMHPLSVAELIEPTPQTDGLIRQVARLDTERWQSLQIHGGFPEPFLKASKTFTNRWRTLRTEQFIKEDLRDYSRANEIQLLESLAYLLSARSGEQIIYANLAKQLQVAPQTAKSWVDLLVAAYLGFLVRPYYRNLAKALRKEPKWFLRDWSGLNESGSRAETLIACHLLKAVEFWSDTGQGTFELRYIRDKQKREVDFIVLRDDAPWFLVEVKQSSTNLSPSLEYFHRAIGTQHAFQVVLDLDFEPINCFDYARPIVVPALTFLSHLT